MSLRIDIRDKRLRGGRLTLDAKTASKVERNRAEVALRDLIDQSETDLIEGLRGRQLEISEVVAAHRMKGVEQERALMALRARVTGEHGPTLREGIDRVMEVVRATKAPKTVKLYEIVAEQMVAHFTPDRLMADILTADATAYLTGPKSTIDGRAWGPGRQNTARMFGSLVWQRVIDDEDERSERQGRAPSLTRNIWRLAESAVIRNTRVEFLRPEEWGELRKKVDGLPVASMLALGCRAGLRASEAAYLRTGLDVDLDRRLIHVRPRTGTWPWRPKSVNSERTVPMPDDLHAILTEHDRSKFTGRTFFLSAPLADRPISYTWIINQTRDAFTAAGIQYGRKKDALTFHSLRHTYASWLTQAGMHPKKVARLIGDTPEMVLKIYGHLAEDDHDEAVTLLNEAVK